MPATLQVGDRDWVQPSGEMGPIRRVVQAADGRPTYEIEFDEPRSGGLCVPDDIERRVTCRAGLKIGTVSAGP
jgi:hypothetical protein